MENIITGIIYIIIGLIGIGLGYVVNQTNNGLTALSANALLYKWAVYAIKYAQEYVSKVGKEKMDWVVAQLVDLCKKAKIKITDEQARLLSEGVYNEIKDEVQQIKYNDPNEVKIEKMEVEA